MTKAYKAKLYSKIAEWAKRYLPAEIIGLVLALVSANIAFSITNNTTLAVIAGTWGENLGFFSAIIYSDIKKSQQEHSLKSKKYNHISFARTLRNIFIEFGTAEALDSFFVRPVAMFVATQQFNNLQIGIIFGKLLADMFYYVPLIISYELRKKHLRDRI